MWGPKDRLEGPLAQLHQGQIKRAEWPRFEDFDRAPYPLELRRHAARTWHTRAQHEYGSVLEFSALLHALTRIGAPIEFTGALGRLLTDEARHAELCRAMSVALVGEDETQALAWQPVAMPFAPAPAELEAVPLWVADVLMTSCCIGETLSRPLYEALINVTTDAVPRSVVRQILRDEHLHAAFGWHALKWWLPRLKESARERLGVLLAQRLAGFESTCSAGVDLAALVGRELILEPAGPDAEPNLGTQPREQFALIFYATLEAEVLPRFEELGLDATRAWRERPALRR